MRTPARHNPAGLSHSEAKDTQLGVPVYEMRNTLHATAKEHGVTIVTGPTGSGKTSHAPLLWWQMSEVASLTGRHTDAVMRCPFWGVFWPGKTPPRIFWSTEDDAMKGVRVLKCCSKCCTIVMHLCDAFLLLSHLRKPCLCIALSECEPRCRNVNLSLQDSRALGTHVVIDHVSTSSLM